MLAERLYLIKELLSSRGNLYVHLDWHFVHGVRHRVDYLKPSGAIGFYHPDWVVVQKTATGEVSWIIETKGRVWEGTKAKDEAIDDWCNRITEQTGQIWSYTRINQVQFDNLKPKTLSGLIANGSGTPFNISSS